MRCIDESDTPALTHGAIYVVLEVSPLGSAVKVQHTHDVFPVADDCGEWFHVNRFEPLFTDQVVKQ